ncbi:MULTISPECIES: hypothetical protein [Gracilibacillus]|uniref:Sporulation protein YpjB n=2 Tax=Gracilibacillus TaxID=74385 RepID=A0ABY4GNN0_9BACI|nr:MULTISPECIES: hypothetical protein [Gracilibacillus]UOQ48108.1 hypothetical protein MUN88_18980 [Gracilibacillus caseinilyticus]UOQ85337.1 hypothetical protein MUN87_00040 [Gracilibacillus salinarum]
MMEFLYFPEDKSLYIPAVLSLLVFVIGACATMYWIKKASKKEQEKWEQEYDELKD